MHIGSMVAERLVFLPHSKKVPGSIPGPCERGRVVVYFIHAALSNPIHFGIFFYC